MRQALSTVGDTFAQIFRHIWTMVAVNLLTVVLSLPFAAVLALLMLVLGLPTDSRFVLIGVFLLTLPTPANAGLYPMMRDLNRGEPIHLGDWWDGLKAFGLVGLRTWLVAMAALTVIFTNLSYYPRSHILIAPVLEIMWVYILALWLCIQLYVFPLIVEQRSTSIMLAYRQAFALLYSYRLFTATGAIAWVGIAALSTISLLIAFLGFAICIGIQQNVFSHILAMQTRTGATGAAAG